MDENEQEEDTRDVFEKVLEYLEPVPLAYALVGAYVGSKVGGKIGQMYGPIKPRNLAKPGRPKKLGIGLNEGRIRNRLVGKVIGGGIGGSYGILAGHSVSEERKDFDGWEPRRK